MHLLLARKGSLAEGQEAIDLGQTPADLIFLTAADTEIAAIAEARKHTAFASLRLANLMALQHPMSVDSYVERTGRHAKLVIVRILGGEGYWPYGLEALHAMALTHGVSLAVLPGDDKADPNLMRFSTLAAGDCYALWQYLVEGGGENALAFLQYATALIDGGERPARAAPLLKAGLWRLPPSALAGVSPTRGEIFKRRPLRFSSIVASKGKTAERSISPLVGETPARAEGGVPFRDKSPTVAIIFYRALVQSGQTSAISALIAALEERGLTPLPIYVSSLKDDISTAIVANMFEQNPPALVLNATGFSVSAPGADWKGTVLDAGGTPVIQIVLSGTSEESWLVSPQGLTTRAIWR